MIEPLNIKIAIASGKGGTGKTFVATNIFFSIANNHNTLLIDCDAEAPNAAAFFKSTLTDTEEVYQQVPVIDENACTFCAKCSEWCHYNAIFIIPPSKIIKVLDDMCHDCGACYAACKFNAIEGKKMSLGHIITCVTEQKCRIIEARMNIGIMTPVKLIKNAIKKSAAFNGIVIIDSPPGTSCPFIQTTSAADYVILVTEPTPFGLSDLKQSIETLNKMNKKYGVIINRAGIGNSDVYDYLKHECIPLLLEIPYDEKIAMLYSTGKIVSEEVPEYQSMFLKAIEN